MRCVGYRANINQKIEKKMKKIILGIIFGSFFLFWSGNLSAASFVKPHDAGQVIEEARISEIPSSLPQESKSRAPEPTSLALFGSGLLGMIASLFRRTYLITKRVFDILAAILGVIFLSPVFLAAAFLIKLTSKGPVIYKQVRVGKNGRLFEIYKFRSMKIDAEKESGPVWAKANDNRMIPPGKFLRKSRIDELPQFINILKGDMSLIGPRPERPVFVEQFKEVIPEYEMRLMVKPGITGMAQVWHKYDETIEDVKKKIKYDLLYIKKVNIWTDFQIFLRTFRVVFTGQGAR